MASTSNGFITIGTDAILFALAGVPVDGTSGTKVGFAGKGSICIDITNANMYVNVNTITSPTWKLVTRAA